MADGSAFVKESYHLVFSDYEGHFFKQYRNFIDWNSCCFMWFCHASRTISSNEERIRNVVSILVQRPDIGGQTSRSSELNLVIDLRNRSIHVKKILENARHAHDEFTMSCLWQSKHLSCARPVLWFPEYFLDSRLVNVACLFNTFSHLVSFMILKAMQLDQAWWFDTYELDLYIFGLKVECPMAPLVSNACRYSWRF